MSDNNYTILIFSSFIIALFYIIAYYSSFISNCDKFPESETISNDECCTNTWSSIGSSVPMTFLFILISIVVSYFMFYWILR